METGMGKLRSLLQFNWANFILLCGALRPFARLMSVLAGWRVGREVLGNSLHCITLSNSFQLTLI